MDYIITGREVSKTGFPPASPGNRMAARLRALPAEYLCIREQMSGMPLSCFDRPALSERAFQQLRGIGSRAYILRWPDAIINSLPLPQFGEPQRLIADDNGPVPNRRKALQRLNKGTNLTAVMRSGRKGVAESQWL